MKLFIFSVRTPPKKNRIVYPYDLTVKNPVNPLKGDKYYSSKKRLDIIFKHTVDLISVKRSLLRCLFFITMQDSSEYYFAGDGVS